MADPEVKYPPGDKRHVSVLRFLNALDDDHNEISWSKLHVIGATLAAVTSNFLAICSTVDLSHIANVITPVIATGYAVTAHGARLNDKRERNAQLIRKAQSGVE